MRRPVFVLLTLALFASGAACGGGQKVGNEELLEFDENAGERLGQRTPTPAEATPGSLTVDKKPTPPPTAKPTPKPETKFFDVFLVAQSPFYKPGNRITVRQGVTIRVTNQDTTAERSGGRSFTDKNGAFHSGKLKPGQVWTWPFNQPAFYEIIDEGLNFATASLEVTP